jgi:hypothetical protein
MSFVILLKLLHVLTGIWFISGLLGRWIALDQAAKATDVRMATTLVGLGGTFERLMVIPGSIAVLVFGFVVAALQGQPVLGFLQGAGSNWLLVSLLLYLSAIPLIPLVFLPRGKRFEAALADAQTRGEVTPALKAAFEDRVVFAAHVYEVLMVLIVTTLMVTKPF